MGGICPRNHRVFLAQMTEKFVYLPSPRHSLLEILPGSPLLLPNLEPSDPEPSTQVSALPVSFLSHLSLPDSALPAAPSPSPELPAFCPAPSPALLYFLCLLRNPLILKDLGEGRGGSGPRTRAVSSLKADSPPFCPYHPHTSWSPHPSHYLAKSRDNP